eukprot:9503326-Pyramimonas_sp.AAC.1
MGAQKDDSEAEYETGRYSTCPRHSRAGSAHEHRHQEDTEGGVEGEMDLHAIGDGECGCPTAPTQQ